jgi:hypothetical protein
MMIVIISAISVARRCRPFRARAILSGLTLHRFFGLHVRGDVWDVRNIHVTVDPTLGARRSVKPRGVGH